MLAGRWLDQQLGELVVPGAKPAQGTIVAAHPAIVTVLPAEIRHLNDAAHKDLASESRRCNIRRFLVKRLLRPPFCVQQLASWMKPVLLLTRPVNSDREVGQTESFTRAIGSPTSRAAPKRTCAQQRAAGVSSTLRSSSATEGGSAEPSFFCRRDAGSTLRFMDSLHFFFETHWDHEPGRVAFVRAPRSVTAQYFGAPFRLLVGKDWFRLGTCALIG